jgi:hypothetical protein
VRIEPAGLARRTGEKPMRKSILRHEVFLVPIRLSLILSAPPNAESAQRLQDSRRDHQRDPNDFCSQFSELVLKDLRTQADNSSNYYLRFWAGLIIGHSCGNRVKMRTSGEDFSSRR